MVKTKQDLVKEVNQKNRNDLSFDMLEMQANRSL